MAKFLIAIFLVAIGGKLIAEIPAFYKPAAAKQALCLEDFKETEKESKERKNSESDPKYYTSSAYRIHLSDVWKLTLQPIPFAYLKPSSGYINPAFMPPNSTSF